MGQSRGALRSWRRKRRFGLLPDQGIDEAGARVGMDLPARLQHMAQQEQAGQPKAVLEILIGEIVRGFALAQERRQPQQPIAPRIARATRYRSAGFRRDIDQVGGLPVTAQLSSASRNPSSESIASSK